MKKHFIALFAAILVFTACISFLSHGKNDVQAVFSCLRTALERTAIYAIENTETNNCFIVQTNKESKTVRIYRRDEKDTLTRYTLCDAQIDTAVVGTEGWTHQSTCSLPQNYHAFLDACESVLKAKSKDTAIIEDYVNLALSSFSSVQQHSSQIIDYNTVAENIKTLSDYLSDRKTKESIGWDSKTIGSKTVIRFYPFCNQNVNEAIVFALLNCLQPEIRELLENEQPIILPVQTDLCAELTRSVFGSLQSLCVYRNEECIFSIRKLK